MFQELSEMLKKIEMSLGNEVLFRAEFDKVGLKITISILQSRKHLAPLKICTYQRIITPGQMDTVKKLQSLEAFIIRDAIKQLKLGKM